MLPTPTKALVAFLQSDATLTALIPGGVWQDVAPPPTPTQPRPVLVFALEAAAIDGEAMQAMGYSQEVWRCRYLVAVEGEQRDVERVRDAAARMGVLLHRTLWNGGAHWQIERSSVVELVERAYVDGEHRLIAIGGRVELVAERITAEE